MAGSRDRTCMLNFLNNYQIVFQNRILKAVHEFLLLPALSPPSDSLSDLKTTTTKKTFFDEH